MKVSTKRILTISAVTAGAGLILMGIGIGLGGYPGFTFSSSGIRSSHQKQEPYSQKKMPLDAFSDLNLSIDSETDIQILPSDDDKYYVEYLLSGEYSEPVCEVKNDTLSLSQASVPTFAVLDLNFNIQEPLHSYVTLYLPKDAVLKHCGIHNDYGSIEFSGINSQSVVIDSDYGNVVLNNTSAENIALNMEDGTLKADTLKADRFSFVSEYGSAELKESVFNHAEFETDYGDTLFDTVKSDFLKVVSEDGNVRIKNSSCKSAEFELEYGNLDFDAAALDQLNCKLEYGNLDLYLPETIQNYQLAVELEYGRLSLPKDALLEHYQNEDDEISYYTDFPNKKGGKEITICNEDGDVNIGYRS